MGDFIIDRRAAALSRLPSPHSAPYFPRDRVLPVGGGRPFAEWNSRGSCGSIWRRGKPDRVWPPRRGNFSLEGDDLVRGHVYADVPVAGGPPGQRDHGPVCAREIWQAGIVGSSACAKAGANAPAIDTATESLTLFLVCGNPAAATCSFSALRLESFSDHPCGSGGTGRRTILRGWRRKA